MVQDAVRQDVRRATHCNRHASTVSSRTRGERRIDSQPGSPIVCRSPRKRRIDLRIRPAAAGQQGRAGCSGDSASGIRSNRRGHARRGVRGLLRICVSRRARPVLHQAGNLSVCLCALGADGTRQGPGPHLRQRRFPAGDADTSMALHRRRLRRTVLGSPAEVRLCMAESVRHRDSLHAGTDLPDQLADPQGRPHQRRSRTKAAWTACSTTRRSTPTDRRSP